MVYLILLRYPPAKKVRRNFSRLRPEMKLPLVFKPDIS